ncbi:MAG: outer membrane lipoprotein carrier protein LolA [Bacteroidota bacterium]
MKNWLIAFLLVGTAAVGWTQTQTQEGADPAAKAILDQMKGIYESYKTLEADFTLEIEIPEQDKEVQKGSIAQMGEKYHLQLADQAIISDGSTLWYYLKSKNEVQINNVEEDGEDEIMSPKELLRIYESDDYQYALTNETYEKGKPVQQIEFKPLDRDSDYSKLRLTVLKKDKAIHRIKVFGKDGSRFTLSINALTPNKSFTNDYFTFDESKHQGVRVEDLRID